MLREDSINIENNVSPFRFAKKIDVQITLANVEQWETINDLEIWRYKITSTNAHSMIAIFENINLPDSASCLFTTTIGIKY